MSQTKRTKIAVDSYITKSRKLHIFDLICEKYDIPPKNVICSKKTDLVETNLLKGLSKVLYVYTKR